MKQQPLPACPSAAPPLPAATHPDPACPPALRLPAAACPSPSLPAPLRSPTTHSPTPPSTPHHAACRLEELDSVRFYKLVKECGLLCRRFSRGHVDVAFTTAKRRKELRRWEAGAQ